MTYKEEFITFMVRSGVLTFGAFTTKSGRKTPYFINTGNYKTGMQNSRLGEFYAALVKETVGDDFDAMFGPAYKGIPLATSVSGALARNYGIDKPFFFNRKEAKDHGEGGAMVGYKPQDGDKIALTVTGGDKTVRKEYTIGGAALYWEDLGLPSGTTEASFAGCYPAPESAEGSEFTFDLSTAADKDLLLAPAMKVSKSADTKVNLAFKHAMHKLAINYASDGTYTQEQLEAVKTTCTAKSSCEVNMAAATVSKTADKTAAFEAAGKAVRFLLVPQTSEEVTLKIEIGGKTGLNEVLKNATQEIPAALDGGKCLTLNLTFGKDGIVVEGSQIGGWEDQGTVDGDISM